jgi:hypothetical protein
LLGTSFKPLCGDLLHGFVVVVAESMARSPSHAIDDRRYRRDTVVEHNFRLLTDTFVSALDASAGKLDVCCFWLFDALFNVLDLSSAAVNLPTHVKACVDWLCVASKSAVVQRGSGDPTLRVCDVMHRLIEKVC